MYTGVHLVVSGVHLVVSRENLSFELFDLLFDHVHWCTLDVKENRIHGLCIPVDSFDLRCESVTCCVITVYTLIWLSLS